MKIIVVGCGRIGSGLAQDLSQSGHTVTVVDSDASAFEQLGTSFQGKTVQGVGFDRDVLLQANIDRTDALAAVTASDEANAVIARLARQKFHVPKVVARLYDRRKAEIYKRLGVQTISSTSWGIKRAAELLCFSTLNSVMSIGNGDVDIVEIEAPPFIVGRKVNELVVVGEIHVIAISRKNKTFLPTMGTVFQENDLIHLAVVTASSGRLKRLLGME